MLVLSVEWLYRIGLSVMSPLAMPTYARLLKGKSNCVQWAYTQEHVRTCDGSLMAELYGALMGPDLKICHHIVYNAETKAVLLGGRCKWPVWVCDSSSKMLGQSKGISVGSFLGWGAGQEGRGEISWLQHWTPTE